MPITGYAPSGLPSVGAGGKATLTSSGMPSQLAICAVDVPQNRWPPDCTPQLTGVAVLVNTCGMAASAVDGTRPATTTAAASIVPFKFSSSVTGGIWAAASPLVPIAARPLKQASPG